MYSILILDVSGSKKKYFQGLIDMANGIIPKQMNNKENEGVIILFVNYEKATINGKYYQGIFDTKKGGECQTSLEKEIWNMEVENKK